MAQKTFTLPNGAKLRTQTSRRYVLLRTEVHETKGPQAWLYKRSDKELTLRTEAARHANRWGKPVDEDWFIGDTVTGVVTPLIGA